MANQSAYDFRPGTHSELALVGRDTPYGEVLRRYWQPVGLSTDATTRPRKIRILSEDLILFRTKNGEPGLLYPRCCHRGASLYYGGVEEDGIRCCYHGWVFDVEGRCTEQPCEPSLGLHRERSRQPWYPVQERYGLIWAYMGPLERKPKFPIYEVFEDLADGEGAYPDDRNFGGGVQEVMEFNWLSHWENVMDPFHVPILHARFDRFKFAPEMALMPEVTFAYSDRGVLSQQMRTLEDGRSFRRVTEVFAPNLRVVPDPWMKTLGATDMIGWVVPFDDTSFKIFTVFKSTDPNLLSDMYEQFAPLYFEMTEDEHRDFPGDYEAQSGQGKISLHLDDFLTTTDQGVSMVRRQMAKQAKIVADGGDPLGVEMGEGDMLVSFESGNYLGEATASPVSA